MLAGILQRCLTLPKLVWAKETELGLNVKRFEPALVLVMGVYCDEDQLRHSWQYLLTCNRNLGVHKWLQRKWTTAQWRVWVVLRATSRHSLEWMAGNRRDESAPVTTAWRVLRLRMEERPPIWRVAANLLNKQSRTADKGWSSSLGVGRGANSSSP